MIPYGGGTADVAFYRGRIIPGQAYDVWYDEAATNRVTGLLDRNDVALLNDQPVADQNGRVWFQAPDDAAPVFLTAVGDLSGDVARLDPADMASSIEGLHGDVEVVAGQVVELQGDVAAVQGAVSVAQADIAQLETDVTQLQNSTPETVPATMLAAKRSTIEPVISGTFREFLVNEAMHNGFPSITKMGNGSLIATWREGTLHGSYDGALKYRISTDNGISWGAVTTLLTPAATHDYRDPNVAIASDGRVIISYFHRINGGAITARVIVSDNYAQTWSSEITVAANSGCSAPVIRLPDGELVVPTYDVTSLNAYLYRSTDNGNTWSLKSTILDDTADLSEPWAVYDEATDDIICLIRNDTDSVTRRKVSTDRGTSWGATTNVFSSDSRVSFIKGASGRWFAFYRDTGTHNSLMTRSSDDAFVTWSAEKIVYSTRTFGVFAYTGVYETSPGVIALLMGVEQSGNTCTMFFGYVTDGPALTPLADLTGLPPMQRALRPGTPVIWDTFQRSDYTTTTGLGSAESGHWWHNTINVIVKGKNAVNATAASATTIINAGAPDGIVSAEFQWNTGLPNTNPLVPLGIIFRRTDGSNYLIAGVAGNNATETLATTAANLYIGQVAAGVTTAPVAATPVDLRAGQWFELTVAFKGYMVTVMIDGYPMVKWMLSAGQLVTGNYVGIKLGSAAGAYNHKCRKFLYMS